MTEFGDQFLLTITKSIPVYKIISSFFLIFIFIVLPSLAIAQSCNLLCVSTECGDFNASFEADGGPVFCEGETITLMNNSDSGFDFFIIDWVYGPTDTIDNYGDVSYEFDIPPEEECGDGSVVFSICFVGKKFCTDGESCQSGTIDFSILLKPDARFAPEAPICEDTPFSITNQSCYAETFFWDFGDGTTSTLESPTHTYSEPGTYTITLEVGNDCGTDETSIEVNVLGLPDADFETIGEEPLCTPDVLTFIDQSNEWGNTFWTIEPDDTVGTVVNWCFQDTTMNASSDSIVVQFKQPGEYTITLTQMGPCDTDEDEYSFIVYETPSYSLSQLPQTFCDEVVLTEEDINFSATGEYSQICWEFENGNPSSHCGETFSVTFTESGSIIMNMESICGNLTDTIPIMVAQTTAIIFNGQPLEFCQDEGSIDLMAFVEPDGGNWSGPGIVNGTMLDPSQLDAGEFNYIYSLSDNPDCPNEEEIDITIIDSLSLELPAVDPACDALLYDPNPVYSGTISSYEWTFDVGGTITTSFQAFPPEINFPVSGSINLTIESEDCNPKTTTIDIIIIDTEQITFGDNPGTLCRNSADVQLLAEPPGGIWNIDGNGGNALSSNGMLTPSDLSPGFYTINYSTAQVAPDCPDEDSFQIEILEEVSVALEEDFGEPCDSLEINLCDFVSFTGAISSYSWNIEGANPPPSNTDCPGIVTIYSVDSPVQISVVVSGECGIDSAIVEVPIGSTTPINISPYPERLCQNSEPITLEAQPSGTWSGPEIMANGYLNPSELDPGTYNFTYTTTGTNCSTSSSVEIEIEEGLSATIETNQSRL